MNRALLLFSAAAALLNVNAVTAIPPITVELRDHVLHGSAREFGIDTNAFARNTWGVVMDIRYDNGLATVVALADGSASLYLGTKSGVIGGHAHERVRGAAQRAVAMAAKLSSGIPVTKDLTPPSIGKVRFFTLDSDGAHATDAVLEEDLGEGRSSFSPLFFAMHDVITELRVASGENK